MENEDARSPGRLGRDELNLAEFPITLLTSQAAQGVKTLTFEDGHGKLTITGSDDYGLPTAPDADVIVGLISLTKLRNNFTDPTVSFSRYELLRLLGWPDWGRYYQRLDESLHRWVGVTLRYDKSWWDNNVKCRVDASFHIIDRVVIYDQEVRRKLRKKQLTLPVSSFTWGKDFFESCRADNLKRLDLDTYFSLQSAISKQLYRFLDKRFYVRGEWTFDLRQLAFEHVGLSRAYAPAKIKEKLQPALEELEALGFLRAMPAAERYINVGHGEWRIRLARQAAPVLVKPVPEPSGLEHELIIRGVAATTAREVVRDFPEDRVKAQIERADWLREKKPTKVKDPGAYLVSAIRDDYAPPPGFESQADRDRRDADERDRRHRDARAKARRRNEEAMIANFWSGLTPEEQARVEADALTRADPEARAACESGPPSLRRTHRRLVREEYLRYLLNLEPEP